jgi:hypothetical protein
MSPFTIAPFVKRGVVKRGAKGEEVSVTQTDPLQHVELVKVAGASPQNARTAE